MGDFKTAYYRVFFRVLKLVMIFGMFVQVIIALFVISDILFDVPWHYPPWALVFIVASAAVCALVLKFANAGIRYYRSPPSGSSNDT